MQDNSVLILAVAFIALAIVVSFSNMRKGRQKRKHNMTDDEILLQKIQESQRREDGKS